MKKLYLFTICFILFSFTTYCQIWDYTKTERSTVAQNIDNAHNIGTDAQGNTYTLGDYSDSLYLNNSFITTGTGSFITKYDSLGNFIWYKLITAVTQGISTIKATDLTINASGIFLTGLFTGAATQSGRASYNISNFNFTTDSTFGSYSIFITKLDFNGNVVWNKISHNYSTSLGYQDLVVNYDPVLTSDKNNNIFCEFQTGSTSTTYHVGTDVIPVHYTNLTPNNFNLLVLKYSSNGVLAWSNYASNDSINQYINCNSMICDTTGNLFVYTAVPSGTQFGNLHFTFHDSTWSPFASVLAKINTAGQWSFIKEMTNNSANIGEEGWTTHLLTVDNNNNVYAIVNLEEGANGSLNVVGVPITNAPGVPNMFLLKYDNAGNFKWYKNYGEGNTFTYSGGSDYTYGISYANKALYFTGSIAGYNQPSFKFSGLTVPNTACSGGLEYFVAKADTSGIFNWVSTICGSSVARGYSIANFNTNVYSCGFYYDSLYSLGNLNGSKLGYQHIFSGKLKDQYIRIGTITPTQLIPGCAISVPFTSTGLTLSTKNTFTAELSDVNGDFTTATAIGKTTSTSTGSITATIPASLPYGSGFRVRIRSSDTLKTGYNYYAYADTIYKLFLTCPAPSTGFTATNITGTAATLNWTVVSCAIGYKVQYRIVGTTTWTTKNITTNTSTLHITGLTKSKVYQWQVASKCKNNGTTSFSPYSVINQFTTLATLLANEDVNDIQIASAYGITIAPNPTKDVLRININNLKTTIKSLQVFNARGSKVTEKTLSISNSGSITVDVSHFASGLYLLLLKTNEGVITKKFIKE